MYTIISATNRQGSFSLKVAKYYQTIFSQLQIETQLFTLETLTSLQRDEQFNQLENTYLIPTKKFIFIMPEYNGSIPGIFKLMIDISNIKSCWNHKKVMFTGISDGRAGNLRGLDMMTNICNYLKMDVYFNKLPISAIANQFENDMIKNEQLIDNIQQQISGFIAY